MLTGTAGTVEDRSHARKAEWFVCVRTDVWQVSWASYENGRVLRDTWECTTDSKVEFLEDGQGKGYSLERDPDDLSGAGGFQTQRDTAFTRSTRSNNVRRLRAQALMAGGDG